MSSYRIFSQHLVETYMSGKTLKAMFVTDAYVPDVDAHATITDVQSFEVSGAGYTAGGVAIPSYSIVEATGGQVQITLGSNVHLDAATLSIGGLVFYIVETSELMAVDMFPKAVELDDTSFDYFPPSDGIVALVGS